MSKALSLKGGTEATETAKFVGMFDKFFDVLYVSNFSNGRKARKPFQSPFYNSQDKRLEVCFFFIIYYAFTVLYWNLIF